MPSTGADSEPDLRAVSYTHLDVYKRQALVLSQDKERIKKEELRTIGAMNQIGALIGIGEMCIRDRHLTVQDVAPVQMSAQA